MKKILFILLLVIAAYLIWRWWNSGSDEARSADRGQDLVYDRIWIDHRPKDQRDLFQVFIAITEQPFGVFEELSSYKGKYELFTYDSKGDGQIAIKYPQTNESERAGYRARKCSEAGFDFCLELQGASRGVRRYYSQRGWEIDGAHDAAALQARAAELLLPAH